MQPAMALFMVAFGFALAPTAVGFRLKSSAYSNESLADPEAELAAEEELAEPYAEKVAAPAPGPVTLYVMRHAEGCHNMKADWYYHAHKGLKGWRDPTLTAHGKVQAEAAQEFFKTLNSESIEHVFTSPMRRAQQTAILALRGTQFENMPLQVAPFANEAGHIDVVSTIENKPTSPAFQNCLFAKEASTYGDRGNEPNLQRCIFRSATCQVKDDNSGLKYSDESKETDPQEFANWVTSTHPNSNVLLATHSNWARKAGLRNENGSKVDWGSVYKVVLAPGQDIHDAVQQATRMFSGTPKDDPVWGKTVGNANTNPECMADITLKEACLKELGEAVYYS